MSDKENCKWFLTFLCDDPVLMVPLILKSGKSDKKKCKSFVKLIISIIKELRDDEKNRYNEIVPNDFESILEPPFPELFSLLN